MLFRRPHKPGSVALEYGPMLKGLLSVTPAGFAPPVIEAYTLSIATGYSQRIPPQHRNGAGFGEMGAGEMDLSGVVDDWGEHLDLGMLAGRS